MNLAAALPHDWHHGRFLGRLQTPAGPSPILITGGMVHDMSRIAPTCAALVAARAFDPAGGEPLGRVEDLDIGIGPHGANGLLSPIDLQVVKAAGVTFAVSALERVIEERARGDASAAQAIRAAMEDTLGGGIRSVTPGSPEAAALKAMLIDQGLWSQYLEVAIGPDAEIFTKAAVLSTVGHGAPIGVRSDSAWNNPEPEVVLLCDPHGTVVGATLGNDVNLRDFEGRSALLLSKAKDNNASCAIGPLVRLFDDGFTIDDVRRARVDLTIAGTDGFHLEAFSTMADISRDPLDLAAQAMSEHHFPDGFVLFLGTLFAPTQDRDAPDRGFTHKPGDKVTIASTRLGTLVNHVTTSRDAPAWDFGISALMTNLAARGLLAREPAHTCA